MKVAIIYPYFPHYRFPIIDLLRKEDKIDYYFLGGKVPSPEFKDLKLIDFPEDQRFIVLNTKWFLKYFSLQLNILREIRKNHFEAVIIYGDWKFLSTWYTIVYLKLKGVPVLFWSHGFRKDKKSLNDFIKERYFNLFDGGFVFDNRAKEVFRKKGYQKRIDVVYNSLDHKKQRKILDGIKSNQNDRNTFENLQPYVVFSGRLTESKNLGLLIEAIGILKKQSVLINVLLIGDGKFKERLKDLSEELNILDQVKFYGSCYDETILAEAFDKATAGVIPSAVGLSAVHALTYGCPVITDTNDIKHGPEIESVVENVTGKFYDSGDAASLAQKILFFLNLTDEQQLNFKQNCTAIISNKFNPEYQRKVFNDRMTVVLENKK